MAFDGWGWRPYIPVAQRRLNSLREMEKRRKAGQSVSPIEITGRKIVTTFWGKAWCENLERYSDFANRLPRGRTYVRNGSVVDLQITAGEIKACVSGSDLYEVKVRVAPVKRSQWKSICCDCAGSIDSLVELLQGRLSEGVMERICRQEIGLFPTPAEISIDCSCPDWAVLCKHAAAVLYGIGARFDSQPELLFRLRAVEASELIASAGAAPAPLTRTGKQPSRVLESDDLSELFGLDIAEEMPPHSKPAISGKRKQKPEASPAPRQSEPRTRLPTGTTARKKKAVAARKRMRRDIG
jgi:uncharacterized Zn finger protein